MDIYTIAVRQIIKQQHAIVGPLALDQAKKEVEISVVSLEDIRSRGNGNTSLEKVVNQYSQLFGQASVEVCRDAVKEITPPIPSEKLPEILR